MNPIRPDTLLFYGYEFFSAFLPFLPVFHLFVRTCRRRGRPLSKTSCALLLLFAVYITGVYHFTGAGTLYEAGRYRLDAAHIQLIPFSRTIDLGAYLLNVALFVPLGMLIPLIWDRLARLPYVLVLSATFSLSLEFTQLLNIRATDIDDLIMNSLGGVTGYILYRLAATHTGSELQQKAVPPVFLPLCVLVPYLGRALLFHDMGLAKLLYGF